VWSYIRVLLLENRTHVHFVRVLALIYEFRDRSCNNNEHGNHRNGPFVYTRDWKPPKSIEAVLIRVSCRRISNDRQTSWSENEISADVEFVWPDVCNTTTTSETTIFKLRVYRSARLKIVCATATTSRVFDRSNFGLFQNCTSRVLFMTGTRRPPSFHSARSDDVYVFQRILSRNVARLEGKTKFEISHKSCRR